MNFVVVILKKKSRLPDSSFVYHDAEAHNWSVADIDFVDDIRCRVDESHHHDSLVLDRMRLCRDAWDHDHHDNHYDLVELEIALNCYLMGYC